MRSNAVKKELTIATNEIESSAQPKKLLKLVETQVITYNEQEGESMEVDYEEFMAQYGIRAFV